MRPIYSKVRCAFFLQLALPGWFAQRIPTVKRSLLDFLGTKGIPSPCLPTMSHSLVYFRIVLYWHSQRLITRVSLSTNELGSHPSGQSCRTLRAFTRAMWIDVSRAFTGEPLVQCGWESESSVSNGHLLNLETPQTDPCLCP